MEKLLDLFLIGRLKPSELSRLDGWGRSNEFLFIEVEDYSPVIRIGAVFKRLIGRHRHIGQ